MKRQTIGQVARQVGVGIDTIRFYERQGLLKKPARTAAGYRLYEEEVVDRLRFIQRAKALGFTLGEIKELLALRIEPLVTCVDIHQRAQEKIADIEQRIESLERIKQALEKLSEACGGRGRLSECPILAAFSEECPPSCARPETPRSSIR